MKPQTIFELFSSMREARQLAADLSTEASTTDPRFAELQDVKASVTAAIVELGLTPARAWELFEQQETPRILARITTLDSNLQSRLYFNEWDDEVVTAMLGERLNLRRQIGLFQ